MQEMELSGVIEKIKQEGVEKAEQQAKAIIDEAENKAKKIAEDALRQKEEIIKKAGEESANTRMNAEKAIIQAARDTLIALKAQVIAILDKIVKERISEQLTPDTLKDIIVKLVTNCIGQEDFDLEILLNEKDKEGLRTLLKGSLQEKFEKGITLKVSPGVQKGFRIGGKGKNLYYDFTDEAIAEAFSVYINKKVKEMLDLGDKDAG